MTKETNKIILGNTLDVLKTFDDNVIDVGITSPPYNKQEKHKGWLVKNVKYDSYRDVKSESEYQQEQIDVLNEIYRITKPGGSFFYNHKIRWECGDMFHPIQWLARTKWTVRQEIVWDRMIAANIRGWRFWQVDERIYWLYKPVDGNKIGTELESRHALLTSVWRFAPERNNPHPAPFPIMLPARVIASMLNDGDGTVLDPYCGSGTTLVAAQLLGKNYIGIDISAEYIDYAQKRILSPSSADVRAVEDEIQKHRVQKTFSQRKDNGEYTGKFKSKKGITTEQKEQELFI